MVVVGWRRAEGGEGGGVEVATVAAEIVAVLVMAAEAVVEAATGMTVVADVGMLLWRLREEGCGDSGCGNICRGAVLKGDWEGAVMGRRIMRWWWRR